LWISLKNKGLFLMVDLGSKLLKFA